MFHDFTSFDLRIVIKNTTILYETCPIISSHRRNYDSGSVMSEVRRGIFADGHFIA